MLCSKKRPHHSAITWSSLVAHSTTDWVPYRLSRSMLPTSSRPIVSLDAVPQSICCRIRTTALIWVCDVIGSAEDASSDRAFPDAAARVWNSLSPVVTLSTSLSSFYSATSKLNFLCDIIQRHILHQTIGVLRIIITFLYRDLEVRLVIITRFHILIQLMGLIQSSRYKTIQRGSILL